jgi:hypothetical protein
MTEALIKRLISLSRIYLILFAFSLVALIHKCDSRELEKDIRAMDLVLLVNQIDLHDAVERNQVAVKAKSRLEQVDSSLAERHREARQELTDALQKVGISETDIGSAKGRMPDDGKNEDRFLLLQVVIPGEDLQQLASPLYDNDDLTLNEQLDKFVFLTQPRALKVVVGLKNLALPNLSSIFSPIRNIEDVQPEPLRWDGEDISISASTDMFGSFGRGGRTSLEVSFDGNDVQVVYRVEPSNIASQEKDREIVDKLPAEIEHVDGISIYGMLKGENREVEQLKNDTEELDKLRQVYGNVKFNMARQIVAEDFIKAYKSISIFGFSFSTRRYPFAILLFSLLAAASIFWTIAISKRRGLALFSNVQHEDVAHMLIDNLIWSLARFCG